MASYSDTFTPPADAAKIARAALEAHAKGEKGGTLVGLARARQLANREPMTLRTIARGHSFFARHEGEGQLPGPARTQAKRLWGGEAGQRWFDSVWAKHREDVIKGESAPSRPLGVGALLIRSVTGAAFGDVGEVEVPEWLGELLDELQEESAAADLIKGAGHKYLRRVPKAGGGFRYFYNVTGGGGLGHHAEMVEGSAFKVKHAGKEGHFHITQDHGEEVTVKHDESGHEQKMSKAALRAMLHAEHAEALGAVKARASKTLEQARKTGTAKQQEKAAALVQKYGGSANQAKTPALDLTAKELEDGFEWVRRLPAKVYGQPIYAYLSQYYEDRRPSLYVSFIDRDGEETNVQAGRLDSVRGKPMSYSVPRSSGFGREGIKPHDLAGWLNDRLGNRPVDKTARLDVLNRRLDSAIQADDKYWMSRLGALVERLSEDVSYLGYNKDLDKEDNAYIVPQVDDFLKKDKQERSAQNDGWNEGEYNQLMRDFGITPSPQKPPSQEGGGVLARLRAKDPHRIKTQQREKEYPNKPVWWHLANEMARAFTGGNSQDRFLASKKMIEPLTDDQKLQLLSELDYGAHTGLRSIKASIKRKVEGKT